jgi:uncharacterized membrane protein YheB (UPF0754 family)
VINLSDLFPAFLASTELHPSNEIHWILFLLPFIAALIGWMTNYIAVKMLFHPKEPKKFIGITFQGVFPKRQHALAEKLGQLVADELFSISDVSAKIKEFATSDEAMNEVGKRIEMTIRNKLVQAFPMLAMFLSDEMVEKVTGLFKNELKDFLSATSQGMGEKLEENLNVKEMVKERVNAFSSEKLEELLNQLMKKEFKFIELVGAILGFFIGCIQLGISLFAY